jgi:hypothetical protein
MEIFIKNEVHRNDQSMLLLCFLDKEQKPCEGMTGQMDV